MDHTTQDCLHFKSLMVLLLKMSPQILGLTVMGSCIFRSRLSWTWEVKFTGVNYFYLCCVSVINCFALYTFLDHSKPCTATLCRWVCDSLFPSACFLLMFIQARPATFLLLPPSHFEKLMLGQVCDLSPFQKHIPSRMVLKPCSRSSQQTASLSSAPFQFFV